MTVRRPRLPLIGVSLALVMAGSGSLAGPVSAAEFHFNPGPWVQMFLTVGEMVGGGTPLIETITGPTTIGKGSDSRLTVLLVGSDYRPRLVGTGERMDSLMVLTINHSRQISAVSIPRDVGNVPIAPGQIYKPKISGLFKSFKKQYGTRELALEHLRRALAYALQIQIDYVAYLRFTGFERLVGQVGGVPVAVPYSIYDSGITDDRTTKPKGAKFLQAVSTLMKGSNAPLCYATPKPIDWSKVPNCTRALLYVRSRHGPGNNDWRRARRQQSFLMAAIRRVIARGSGANLTALRTSALSNSTDFYTTMPLGLSDVSYLYGLFSFSSMPNQAVLSPPTYAFTVPGTSKQELRLDAVRSLTRAWFGPLS